jgi:hypothetical protein
VTYQKKKDGRKMKIENETRKIKKKRIKKNEKYFGLI